MFKINESDGIVELEMAYGKVNLLDIEFCRQFASELAGLESSSCRAVILKGNGRVFSAGIDLKRMLAEDESYVEPFMTELERVMERVFVFPKPIVAAISGHAIAGGCMIAAACDYRLIGPETRIGIPEMRIGVPLPMTAIEIMRFVADPTSFQSVVNVGALYEGSDAVDAGLANEVVEESQMTIRAQAVAREFAQVPLAAFWMTKRQSRAPSLRNIVQNKSELQNEFRQIWLHPETRATIQAYVAERLSQ